MSAGGQARPGPDRDLLALIGESARRVPPPAVAAMADHLAAHAGVLAVLFYGNMMRDSAASGLLDFYVLTESDAAYHGRGLSALANRLLPPNVYFHEIAGPDGPLRAKVAVMTLGAFRARMRPASWDTTLWARFTQPALIVRARDEAARTAALDALAAAARAGAWWAARFGAGQSGWRAVWEALFARTYGAELRVEGSGRAGAILDAAPGHFERLHAALIADAAPSAAEIARAEGMWRRRRLVGKFLNAARLTKAAATFRGGLAYAIDKVERHTGRPVELSGWQRRLPALAAPVVFLRLLWQRRLR